MDCLLKSTSPQKDFFTTMTTIFFHKNTKIDPSYLNLESAYLAVDDFRRGLNPFPKPIRSQNRDQRMKKLFKDRQREIKQKQKNTQHKYIRA